MMKTVVLMPYSPEGCEYRARAWHRVRSWIAINHSLWPVYTGKTDHASGRFFPIAKARNNAARAAGDWDIAVFWDADTLVHPDAVNEAVALVKDSPLTQALASDAHTYMDELSTQRFYDSGLMFPMPRGNKTVPFSKEGIYRRPCSGVFVVHRELWEATGGYVEALQGNDSHEDLVFLQCCRIFGDGTQFIPGMQLHLWHPPAPRTNGVNHRLWQDLSRCATKQLAHNALAPYRHQIPFSNG
jgi:predicted glycosyltransferase involved in capsule biosynthesis